MLHFSSDKLHSNRCKKYFQNIWIHFYQLEYFFSIRVQGGDWSRIVIFPDFSLTFPWLIKLFPWLYYRVEVPINFENPAHSVSMRQTSNILRVKFRINLRVFPDQMIFPDFPWFSLTFFQTSLTFPGSKSFPWLFQVSLTFPDQSPPW